MPAKQEVYHLQPTGWKNDPLEERFKVSTLDYLGPCIYANFALFFRLADEDKHRAVAVLRAGLERTLSQARHLCGTIEKDPSGGHSFVKKWDSTVRFFVQWLDSPEDSYPSFDDIDKANYGAVALGDLGLWSVHPMTCGEKPEAHPDNSPVVAAFKANFVRGGLVLNLHHHHYANDIMGWIGFVHQLADNCYAVANKTPFPFWDTANIDSSRFTKAEVPEDAKVENPVAPPRHPDHTQAVTLLFHLPKSKAAELKRQAQPADGSRISTYDAFSAFIWRSLTRLRAPVFKPDMSSSLFWGEVVDMRRRLHTPKCPARIQGNVVFAALSIMSAVPQPTVADVVSAWPLADLALYIRQLTNSVTQENLDKALDMVARFRDRTAVSMRLNIHPPMSIMQTDHRDADMSTADFGFATPVTYRHLLDDVVEGVIVIYPPRNPAPESDEGSEFSITYETRLVQSLLEDPEWSSYFEYRGVDAVDAGVLLAKGREGVEQDLLLPLHRIENSPHKLEEMSLVTSAAVTNS